MEEELVQVREKEMHAFQPWMRRMSYAAAVVVLCLVCLSVPSFGRSTALTDGTLWVPVGGNVSLTERELYLEGPTGGAFYDCIFDVNETLEVSASFSFTKTRHSWIAFKLRSNLPEGQIWENQNTYFLLLREGSASVGKVQNAGPATVLEKVETTILSEGETHELRFGVVNRGTEEVPVLFLEVDGQRLLTREDPDANEALRHTGSAPSINVFQGGAVTLSLDPGASFIEKAHPEMPDPERFVSMTLDPDMWGLVQAIPSGPDQFSQPHLLVQADACLRVKGLGSVVYRDAMQFHALRLTLKMLSPPDMGEAVRQTFSSEGGTMSTGVTLLLHKQERDSYTGQNTIGLFLAPDGHAAPVIYSEGKRRQYPGVQTGMNFSEGAELVLILEPGRNSLSLCLSTSMHSWVFELPVAMQDKQSGFFGFISHGQEQLVEVGPLCHTGRTAVKPSKQAVLPPYMPLYLEQEDGAVLFWKHRADQPQIQKVIIRDDSFRMHAEVRFPGNVHQVPDSIRESQLFLATETLDGTRSAWVAVALEKRHHDDDAGRMQRVRVFSDKQNGAGFRLEGEQESYLLNGVNHVVLRYGDHAFFEPAGGGLPAVYEPLEAESLLRTLRRNGLNTVRVFLSSGRTAGNPGTGGTVPDEPLSGAYLDNVADFLVRAAHNGIHVVLTLDDIRLPDHHRFLELAGHVSPEDWLFHEGYLQAKVYYVQLLLEGLKARTGSFFSSVLALAVQNEFILNTHQAPLMQTEGHYFLEGNGTVYRMDDAKERQALVYAAAQRYFHLLRQTVKKVDPLLLMTVGTCSLRYCGVQTDVPQSFFPEEGRFVTLTAQAFLSMEIDFLDLHVYSLPSVDEASTAGIMLDLQSMGLLDAETRDLLLEKPLVMFEYGVRKQERLRSEAQAFLLERQETARLQGFRGTLMWSMDNFGQTGFHHAMEWGDPFLEKLAASFQEPVPVARSGRQALWGGLLLLLGACVAWSVRKRKRSRRKEAEIVVEQDRKEEEEPEESVLFPIHVLFREAQAHPFRLNPFGEARLWYRGELLQGRIFSSIKVRELLEYLLHEARDLTRDEIAESLWPERQGKNASDLFHTTLYHLRKDLRRIDPRYAYVQCKNRLYGMEPGVFFSDQRFFGKEMEALIGLPVASEPVLHVLEEILALYQKPYLHSLNGAWANDCRTHCASLRKEALTITAQYHLSHEQFVKAEAVLMDLASEDPYDEKGFVMRLQLHAARKEFQAVHALYDEYEQLLREELGIPPSQEVVHAYSMCMDSSDDGDISD